jgi:hypothetical protein
MAERKTIPVTKMDPTKYTSPLNPDLRPKDASVGTAYWNGTPIKDAQCVCDSDHNLWCKDANGDWHYAGQC